MIIITFGFCKFKNWIFFQQAFFFFFSFLGGSCELARPKNGLFMRKKLILNSKVYFLSYEVSRPRNELLEK